MTTSKLEKITTAGMLVGISIAGGGGLADNGYVIATGLTTAYISLGVAAIDYIRKIREPQRKE